MADKKKSPFMFALGLALIGLCLIVFLLPKQTVIDVGARERASMEKQMGEKTAAQVKGMADAWYTAAFINTGILYTTYNFLFDQWEGPETERTQFDDRGLSRFVEKRVDVVWLVMYQVIYRLAASSIWLPYLLPFLLVVGMDGYFEREIRKYRFSYASPVAVRGGTQLIILSVASVFLAPFIPVSIPAQTIPVLIGLIAICLWVLLANSQKRM